MASLQISSQSIEHIDSNKYFIKFDIETNVKPNASFNLTVNNKNPVNLIVSPYIYHGLQNDICTRTNANSYEIKIYGFHGGKELARVLPGSNKMGNVTYPEIQYSLLSQIVFPNPEPNSHYILVVDSLPALSTIEHEDLKAQLLVQDYGVFIKNLNNFVKSAESVGSVLESILLEELHEAFQISGFINKSIMNPNKMVRYLGDILFGRIFGGTQTNFSTILSLTENNSNKNVSILNVFSQPLTDLHFKHDLTVRGSGLVISGNTSSSIGIILETSASFINTIKLSDVNSGLDIYTFSTSTQNHSESYKLELYIRLIEYANLTRKLDLNDRVVCKSHMQNNKEFIELIEFSELDDLHLSDDKFATVINKNIYALITNIKCKWLNIRSIFGREKSNHDNRVLPAFPPRGLNFEYSDGNLAYNSIPGLNYKYSDGIVSHESTPGLGITTRQYTEYSNKKVSFDELNGH